MSLTDYDEGIRDMVRLFVDAHGGRLPSDEEWDSWVGGGMRETVEVHTLALLALIMALRENEMINEAQQEVLVNSPVRVIEAGHDLDAAFGFHIRVMPDKAEFLPIYASDDIPVFMMRRNGRVIDICGWADPMEWKDHGSVPVERLACNTGCFTGRLFKEAGVSLT